MTLVHILRRRARDQGERQAFSFEGQSLSYAELDVQARSIAATLQRRGGPGERAMLVFPPGLDFVAALFGCLYAGWIAVPTASARPEQLAAIAQDAQPLAVLRPGEPLSDPDAWQEPGLEPEALAILQYTSGSTRAPRGVVLSHANVLHNTRQIERRFEIEPRHSKGVIWLPPFHDMGLIGGIVQGVVSGFPIALMAPLSFLRRPVRWLEAITRERATISGGPNFAYELCIERITPEERKHLDLSSWEVAFNGAEPVRAQTLERFSETFAECGFRAQAFYPCYGLAEATLIVCGGAKASLPVVRDGLVSCGRVVDDQELEIVDGEIWVRGPSVARGYWRNREATRETFEAYRGDGEGPYLRTGDLGLLEDGELYVTGRLKAVLIVGGRKVHAEDVEQTVAESHDAGWPGGIAALEVRERLVIVQELAGGAHARGDEVVHAIRRRVAEAHQVPVSGVVLVRPGNIPRTSSGKVRRSACADMVSDGRFDALREWQLA